MSWDAVGAIAELLGAAAVFLSLIYLAVQTRQNTQALRSAAFHQVRDSFSEVSLAMSQNPELLGLTVKAIRGEELSEAEEIQVNFIFTTMTRKGESACFQSNEGNLQLESWLGIRATLLGLLSNPRGIAWLEGVGDRFTRDYLEDLAEGARQQLETREDAAT